MLNGKIHIGIGFATGRTSFCNVLSSYIYHLNESGFAVSSKLTFSLFVAYDPTYSNTTRADYSALPDSVGSYFGACHFIGPEDIVAKTDELIAAGVVEPADRESCFGNGYAAQRNIVMYEALRNKVDYLIFIDDDEYPMAVTSSGDYSLWSGQHVIEDHVKYLRFADITNGYHCGYISPLPSIEFDGIVTEEVFRSFVEALSSDVLKWDSVLQIMQNGGVTYADKSVLINRNAELVEEEHHSRFITGGNLGLNLTDPSRALSFYNPPGARGEDSFLSTCLSDHTVKHIPTYTFHDGFSIYGTLLHGVLPTNLKAVSFYDSQAVINRFYRACIGWIRYKPLYTYITRREEYESILADTRQKLEAATPKICAFFNSRDFANVPIELEKYAALVPEHYEDFARARTRWEKIKAYAAQ